MNSIELDQRIVQIEGFIKVLTQQCPILDERRHILAPLLHNAQIQDALKKKLDNNIAAGAWHHLVPMLGQDLLRDQSRLFLDADGRSGSLTNLWRKLQADPALREHFRAAYAGMFDEFHEDPDEGLSLERSKEINVESRESDRARNGARFDEGWDRVRKTVDGLASDPVAVKIKMFRDKHHAHLQMQKLDKEPKAFDPNTIGLTFNEIFEFGDRCQHAVAELGLLLTGITWDPEAFADVHARRGTAMWKALTS
ncbi:hypothetical protein [Luteimonas fraxinea]|uniref:HEPN AbiU2-like domain-containing protein n=1 Tax=Luteimonas fraxinea TaxID=2901869 RepID=A0ABS8UCG7_9GAMM|nr:hypothetical protein [Luteimonas fraxinea]MCD9096667.1 hypothetical protein [Luteimonas fraxinea]MCD9126037.1 hypothetical protein [Luteimonas fraxinea]